MARTIGEIYDSLNLVKGSMPELGVYVNNDQESVDTARKLVNDVRTNSKVGVWRLWLWIMAVGSWVIENLQDTHEALINLIIESKRPHTLRWYANETKKFQYGHEIVWVNDQFGYEVIDEAAMIVKHSAAVEEENGGLLKVKIKAMKQGKAVLTAPEILALGSFWATWKDAGVKLEIVSLPVNKIWVTADIYRNRNIVNSNNTLIIDSGVNVVETGASEYFDSIEYNGLVNFISLANTIRNKPGITDMIITVGHIDAGEFGPSGSGVVRPASGFAEMDWTQCVITYHDSYE